MPPRFVILHHRLATGEHWDLMLEHGEKLMTWQLERPPTDPADLPIRARRIGDHRKLYLDYEGPVSGNRGEVHQLDSGTVEFLDVRPTRCRVRLLGRLLSGEYVLRALDEGHWLLEPSAEQP